jgi:RNA polymerase sigma-70 factor (ECF subfamily)
MSDPEQPRSLPKSAEHGGTDLLLSDEPTVELVLKARAGDGAALEALLERCLPQLRRWAHGRLPPAARGHIDTEDLVQDAALNAIRRLDSFVPRHVGAMQAYLRQSVINRVRDEIRRIGRHPAPDELPEEMPADAVSPLEEAIRLESYEIYRAALRRLRVRDREIIVARIEAQWTVAELAERFSFSSVDAARVATTRAAERLMEEMRKLVSGAATAS